MDTDQKQIGIATFRLTQRCALAPFDNRFILPSVSVFIPVHPWLKGIVSADAVCDGRNFPQQ